MKNRLISAFLFSFSLLIASPDSSFATSPPISMKARKKPKIYSPHSRRHRRRATKTFGAITITRTTPTNASYGLHGYAEIRFQVQNSSSKTQKVGIDIRGRSYYSLHLGKVTRSVVVGPGSTASVTLLRPKYTLNASYAQVRVNGRRVGEIYLNLKQRYITSRYDYHKKIQILFSNDAPIGFRSRIARSFRLSSYWKLLPLWKHKKAKTRPYSYRYKRYAYVSRHRKRTQRPSDYTVNYQRAEQPVVEWSKHWQYYAQFHGIILTSNSYKKLPALVKKAIHHYVDVGGSLTIYGAWSAPASWKKHRFDQTFLTAKRFRPAHRWYHSTTAKKENVDKPFFGIKAYHKGFGSIYSIESSGSTEVDFAKPSFFLFQSWYRNYYSPNQRKSMERAQWDFPVIKKIHIPVQGMFLFTFFFVLLMGPINWFFFAKKSTHFFWTLPLISLIACIFVLVYGVFTEGWSSFKKTKVITLLNQETNQAVTIGWRAYYTPTVLSDGLRFQKSTEVNLQASINTRGRSSLEIDWNQEQHLSSGWLQSRLPSHLWVRKVRFQRKKLLFSFNQGKLTAITNGLGAKVKRLWYRRKGKKGLFFSNIHMGAKVQKSQGKTFDLSSYTKTTNVSFRKLPARFFWDPKSVTSESLLKHLRPGSYLAEVEGSPFLESGGSFASRGETTFVLGSIGGKNHGS